MITDTHDNNICAQKLNRNRTFFNRSTISQTLDFKRLIDNKHNAGVTDDAGVMDIVGVTDMGVSEGTGLMTYYGQGQEN